MTIITSIKETSFKIGDLIRVHQTLSDKDKDKIQVFEGRVISIRGRGENKSFTVRKIGANKVGVEKVYPTNLPSISRIEVMKSMKTRRSKLYFLRDIKGRVTKKQM